MSNIDEKLASIPTSPLLAERMTKKQPSCENDPKIAGCSDDTISRMAVIDLLKQMRKDGDMVPWEGKNVFARIRELPTIQPELSTNLAEVGTDYISRKALINKFEQWQKQDGYDNGEWNLLVDVITEIKNMPLATDIYVGTNDVISREQAIDALRNYLVGKNVPCDGTLT